MTSHQINFKADLSQETCKVPHSLSTTSLKSISGIEYTLRSSNIKDFSHIQLFTFLQLIQ